MSDTTHTPGKLVVIDDRQLYANHNRISDAILIAEVTDTAEGLEGSDAEADANAKRLTAAWNATLPLTTPEIEDVAKVGIDNLLTQRAELLAALKAAEEPDRHFKTCEWCSGYPLLFCKEYVRLRAAADDLRAKALLNAAKT